MSKKQKKLIDIAKLVRTVRNKTHKFVQHKILSTNKSLLLVGGDTNPYFKNKLIDKFKSSWKIANLSNQVNTCDFNTTMKKFSMQEIKRIESQLSQFSKIYECIILMPEKQDKLPDLNSEDLLDQFYCSLPNKVEMALTTFRLANRFLANSGTVILSSCEKPFLPEPGLNIANHLIENQVSCINVLLGERDYTDIDSYNLSALIEEHNLQESSEEIERILELYKTWSQGHSLPMPGSFARLMKKQKAIYPVYY